MQASMLWVSKNNKERNFREGIVEILKLLLLFIYVAASEPVGITVMQEASTTIRVSWTAPTSGVPPTGYQIYYSSEPEDQFSHVVTIGASEREYVLTGLQSVLVYGVSIMALSPHLPSPVIGPMIPGRCLDISLQKQDPSYIVDSFPGFRLFFDYVN